MAEGGELEHRGGGGGGGGGRGLHSFTLEFNLSNSMTQS